MRRRYPWEEWQDGKLRTVADPDRTLAGVLRTRAARTGTRVRTSRDASADALRFQFRAADDPRPFARLFDAVAPAEPGAAACEACGQRLQR